MFQVIQNRICQTCKHCTPKDAKESMGLFCESPKILKPDRNSFPQNSPTSIFWAVLKYCGEKREFWEEK